METQTTTGLEKAKAVEKWRTHLFPAGLAILILLNILIFMEHLGFSIVSRYYKGILILAFINIILAVSLNLINGITGLFSIGHAGFMAVGAYVSALLSLNMGRWEFVSPQVQAVIQFPLVLLAGGLAAALAGLVIGIPTLRLRGDYLAIATLGFGEIIRVVALNLNITRGARGIASIPNYTSLWWAQLFAVVTVVIIWNIVHSNHGRAMVAIREDEIAAEAMGINTTYYKVLSFTIGAFFAGVAGGLLAHHLTFISPKTFDVLKSIEILLMVVLGGLGSITGSVIAAIVLTALPEVLRFLQAYRMVIYAGTLVVLMIFRPQGLFGRAEVDLTVFKSFFRSRTGEEVTSRPEKRGGNGGSA